MTKGEAFSAYRDLLESVQKQLPDAKIQGVLVGPMAKKGVEIIIGTLLDETFGPLVMVGLGGVATELFRDVIYRPAPVSAAEAATMLDDAEGRAAVERFSRGPEGGHRGAIAIDRAGLAARRAAAQRGWRDRAQPGARASGRPRRHDRRRAGGEEKIGLRRVGKAKRAHH